ncbi:alpha-1,3-mannosyl-glycoprotein 4-beta-N-acetylglucosaminyltransferase-like protein MGAT4E [Dromiciops gliroides]|uniref:alpha-1,3-mannosyl-glycoprotein 4-beta-N-acetylglucosaminyltransferase-like protein MGAT4E n=1 Tax=Dromiciops gliroides TaxID=33562 RepID=UPI001CC40C63|nr:alpha-1,3-mannosyl-glycoprotein 4-beta-N-acetylglucosaminyltransferase-like protein MGAT4E [Dromiciops gliroides]
MEYGLSGTDTCLSRFQGKHPMLGIMRWSFRHYTIILAGSGLLWFFISLGTPKINEDIYLLETKRSLDQKFSSKSEEYLQWSSYNVPSRVSHLTYQYLAGALPLEKKTLTVGLSSMQSPTGKYLMSTLRSVFKVSSNYELRHITVLVHLADPDPYWLNETVSIIISLFTPQILRGQLIVIHAPSAAYQHLWSQPHIVFNFSDVKTFRSKQMLDYAFLMSFAANLSDYFLMIKDDIRCTPNFVTIIQQELEARKDKPWTIMESANRGLAGKLCHSMDLPKLAGFLLLFYKDESPDMLLLHFRILQGQKDPIHLSPFLFYHFDRSSSYFPNNSHTCEEPDNEKFQEDSSDIPDNPPAVVYTDMQTLQNHLPQNAYSLDETFFLTPNALPGHQLTVILDEGVNVIRVQVLTGTPIEKLQSLEEGKVELGSNPAGQSKHCTKYTFLGQLWDGQLDCRLKHRQTGHNVSCVRLLVTSPRDNSWVMVRHINIWVNHEE